MPHLAVAVFAASLLAPIQEPGDAEAPTVVLEGCVVDVRGEPVPMADITVTKWKKRDVVVAKGLCDGDGAFRIGRVPREPLRVEAHRVGYSHTGVLTADAERPLRIPLSDATIVRGVLRDGAGKRVAGAVVRAALLVPRDGLIDYGTDARTDADGVFTLRDVPLGMVRFVAAVPGEGMAELREWIRGETDVVLHTVSGAATTTLQVAIEGLPADAFASVSPSVMLNSKGGPMPLPPPWDAPVFDREGRFEMLGLPDAGYVVRLRADAFAFTPAETVTKPAGPHQLRFTADPLRRCPVRVCDRDGAPVAGVRCTMHAAVGVPAAVSASDGMVTFTTAAAVGSTVLVSTQDKRWVGTARDALDPAKPLQLRVQPACRVRGRVVHDGRPVPFAHVWLRKAATDPAQPMTFVPVAIANADRDGNFEFGGLLYRPDRLRVIVTDEQGSGSSEPFALAEATDPVTAPPVKLQAPATIEGKVSDAQGAAPGVRVLVITSEYGKLVGRVDACTDRAGRFRIVGVCPGQVAIEIAAIDNRLKSRRVVEPFEVEAGKKYAFDLERP